MDLTIFSIGVSPKKSSLSVARETAPARPFITTGMLVSIEAVCLKFSAPIVISAEGKSSDGFNKPESIKSLASSKYFAKSFLFTLIFLRGAGSNTDLESIKENTPLKLSKTSFIPYMKHPMSLSLAPASTRPSALVIFFIGSSIPEFIKLDIPEKYCVNLSLLLFMFFIGEEEKNPSVVRLIMDCRDSIEADVSLSSCATPTIFLADSRSLDPSSILEIGPTNPCVINVAIDSKNPLNLGIAPFTASTSEPLNQPDFVIGTIFSLTVPTVSPTFWNISDIEVKFLTVDFSSPTFVNDLLTF